MTTIRQTIYDLCALAEESKVPILIVSNPGYAKTTCIQAYAKDKDYHLETLVGSRYEATDISGYLVNEPGQKNLVHKEPTWFTRIWEAHNKGKKSLLFIDELSTCPDRVQGTLLTLIFDRTIGENKFLPEDTVILSAANYANNLNEDFDIISPTLNRFCIFNLTENKTTNDILDEFLTDKYLEAKIKVPSKESIEDFDETYAEMIKGIFSKHNNSDSSLGYLDLKNTDFQDLYRMNDKTILNVITGRSLSYLKRILSSVIQLKITDRTIIDGLVDGLVGAGTCSFKEESQQNAFRKEIKDSCFKLCKNKSLKEEIKVSLPDELSKAIIEYINLFDNKEVDYSYILGYEKKLTDKICKKYDDTIEVFNSFITITENKEYINKGMEFVKFYDCLSELLTHISDDTNHSKLSAIHQSLMCIYNDLMSTDYKLKDFERQYGLNMPKTCDECLIANIADPSLPWNMRLNKVALFGRTQILLDNDQAPVKANLADIITGSNVSIEHLNSLSFKKATI